MVMANHTFLMHSANWWTCVYEAVIRKIAVEFTLIGGHRLGSLLVRVLRRMYPNQYTALKRRNGHETMVLPVVFNGRLEGGHDASGNFLSDQLLFGACWSGTCYASACPGSRSHMGALGGPDQQPVAERPGLGHRRPAVVYLFGV